MSWAWHRARLGKGLQEIDVESLKLQTLTAGEKRSQKGHELDLGRNRREANLNGVGK